MPTAKKLPSGSWRCRIFAGYEIVNGQKKRVYKSFTVKDPSRRGKKECERLASEWALDRQDPGDNITVFDACRKYIDLKEKVLSPATIRGYENYLKTRISPIQSTMIRSLTQTDVQMWINNLSVDCSPKYIKNVYGFFSTAVSYFGGRKFDVTFPSAAPPDLHTPCDEEITKLLQHIKDRPDLRAAVLLAAFGSLRRSEICALLPSDFHGNRVSVTKSMVRDKDDYWVTKPMAKTDKSNRVVVLPDFVMDYIDIPKKGEGRQAPSRADHQSVLSCCQIFRVRHSFPLPRPEALLCQHRARPGRPGCLHHGDGRLADRQRHAQGLQGYSPGCHERRAGENDQTLP